MDSLEHVKIAELKANLSAYLSRVRKGEVIVVSDRSTPIAKLTPLEDLDDLIVSEAIGSPAEARKFKGLKLLPKGIDVDRVLAETRADK